MSSVVFELVCTSLQQFTIMFEHPLQDTMVTGKNGSLLVEYQLSFFQLHVEKMWNFFFPIINKFDEYKKKFLSLPPGSGNF